jgi:hypothetical protein
MMSVSQFKQFWFQCAGTLVVIAALVGCAPNGPPVEPKILTFNYVVASYADPAALIAALQNGQTTVADELPTTPCNFTADAAASTPLSIDILGTPGQAGFNVTITSATLVNITTTNPANCQPVSEIAMTIGDANEALGVGGKTNRTSAELVVGGDRFDTNNRFFAGSLTGYNQQTGYASGEFQFAGSSPGTAPNVLLLGHGSFADD